MKREVSSIKAGATLESQKLSTLAERIQEVISRAIQIFPQDDRKIEERALKQKSLETNSLEVAKLIHEDSS